MMLEKLRDLLESLSPAEKMVLLKMLMEEEEENVTEDTEAEQVEEDLTPKQAALVELISVLSEKGILKDAAGLKDLLKKMLGKVGKEIKGKAAVKDKLGSAKEKIMKVKNKLKEVSSNPFTKGFLSGALTVGLMDLTGNLSGYTADAKTARLEEVIDMITNLFEKESKKASLEDILSLFD